MIRINLLPSRPKKRLAITAARLPGLGLVLGLLYLLAAAAVGGYWYVLDGEAGTVRAEIARIEKESARLKTAIAEGERFRKEKEDLERRLTVIESLSRNQTRPIHLLDALADAVPRDVWLTSMEEKDKGLRIAGSAFSATAVADFMANLKQSGKFRDVDLVVSRQDVGRTPRVVTFEVACRFDI